MKNVGRTIIAVLAGAAVWAILWVGGTQAATATFPNLLAAGQPVTHTGALLGLIIYSIVLSVLAGYVTAAVATGDRSRAVWILAILQLALGVFVETSSWKLAPAWYHIAFLALIVPATLYGGVLRVRRRQTQPAYMT
jgi:hypothetical protein